MDLQRIKALIDLLAQSPLAELELIEGDDRVRLVKTAVASAQAASAVKVADTEEAKKHEQPETAVSIGEARTLVAPMFGVVHLTPAPNEAAFVKAGDVIAQGQVVCTIEAMKMFNAIEADCAGTLTEVLVNAGDEVQSGQSLFTIQPAAGSDHV
jgi:acetyl-CoA carboxylase biotin carboxyl carrier protein